VGLVQLAGQRLELGLGLERRFGVVGQPHPLLGHRAELVWQLVDHVADLVLLMPTSA